MENQTREMGDTRLAQRTCLTSKVRPFSPEMAKAGRMCMAFKFLLDSETLLFHRGSYTYVLQSEQR